MRLHIVENQAEHGAGKTDATAALENPTLNHLAEVLHDAVAWLTHERIPYFLMGAVAEALLWRPRLTRHIEIMAVVPEIGLATKMESAPRFALGIEANEGAETCTAFLRHAVSLAGVAVTARSDRFEQEAARHALKIDLNGLAVRVATPEDHLLLQTRRGVSDVDDLEEILRSYPQADRNYMLRYLSATPELPVAARMAKVLQSTQQNAADFPRTRSLARM